MYLKEKKKKERGEIRKPEQLIQYSGHMATEPLRTATKKANLQLSARAYIEAIEYDSHQRPAPPRRHPLGQQKKSRADPDLSS